MKRDPIEVEELWRSVAVYFFFFLVIGALNIKGYVSIGGLATIFLAFLLTAGYFSLMVRYRKKEGLIDSSIFSIIGYMLQPKSSDRRNSIDHRLRNSLACILSILEPKLVDSF
ncbi:MAG: hypothetical protein PHG90_06325 [Clostridia bacterium]|nr:hypothetical protein [Clostridia bacterium]